jgi:hypothetical protein
MVRSLDLGTGRRLDVVRENGNDEVLITLVEGSGRVTRRTKISLTTTQAVALARHLTGISCIPDG